jgi:membrane protease YdiL (CAAX protease family)
MLAKIIRRHSIVSFYVLTFGFSLSFTILAYVIFDNSLFLAWIGMFCPAIAGLVVTGISEGREGVEKLLAGLLHWRVPWGSYLVVFATPLLLVAGTILIHDGTTELVIWANLLAKLFPFLIGMTLLMIIPIAGEEIGWRGFALPRLQERYSSIAASLLIGFLWGIWHIPAALDPTNVLNRGPLHLSILIFTIGTIGFSFLYTWLWNYSGNSLLLICIFHSFYNIVNSVFSEVYPYIIDQHWIYLIVIIVILLSINLTRGRKYWQVTKFRK